MKFDLEKYLPLNSKKKVDILLNSINENSVLYDLRNDILKKIDKIVVKVYFKKVYQERIESDALKNIDSKIYKTNPRKSIKQEKQIDYNFVYSLNGLSIKEISLILNKSEDTILSLIYQRIKNKDVNIHTILGIDDLKKCASFISNIKKRSDRSINEQNELANELLNSPSKRLIYKENSQKSYGKEGNYSKLIYIKTKS